MTIRPVNLDFRMLIELKLEDIIVWGLGRGCEKVFYTHRVDLGYLSRKDASE